MKSGFTLVEIAITLVIIGSIMGMTVKGRKLIRTAQVKSDLMKIPKIETALYTYYAENNKWPPIGTDNMHRTWKWVDKTKLYDKIKKEDLEFNYIGSEITILWCETVDYNKPIYNPNGVRYSNDLKMIRRLCVHILLTKPGVCYVENMIDDNSISSGIGKAWRDVADTPIDFYECENNIDENFGRSAGSYSYSI